MALVKPLLKKVGMDLINTLYCPVSNLLFLSKVVEKSVLLRFNKHCDENNLKPDYQSAYTGNFSCEAALLKLTNYVLWVMEHQEVTPLVAIAPSAAFDTIDHDLFLSILSKKFGVADTALMWFDSYVRPRRFQVQIDDTKSKEIELTFSVSQGSCAGPVLYSAYATTLQEVIQDPHGSSSTYKPIDLHGFADDHVYKKSFAAKSRTDETNTMGELENFASRIKNWMDGKIKNEQYQDRIYNVWLQDDVNYVYNNRHQHQWYQC